MFTKKLLWGIISLICQCNVDTVVNLNSFKHDKY